MSIKKVSTSELDAWIDGLASDRNVIGVQAKSDRFEFAPLKSAADLKLGYDITILPPKTLFQPAKETLCSFDMTKGYESVVDDSPMVILGVHPYDLVAIAQMDKIFEEGNSDTRYFAKRNNATIVAVDVQAPSADTFAGHMGTAHVESGYDVLLTKIGDEYLVDAATDKGKDLVNGIGGASASDEDVECRKALWAENDAALKKHDLKAGPSEWPALLEKSLDNPIWEEKAEKCFSCGSCNLACPTCYCFDVQDDVNWDLSSGERVRTWDSCILTNFALVAGDHNFRKKRADRYRHRYYRKGSYVPSKLGGEIACVGCGRCITACVAKIANPVEIFNKLLEDK